MQSEIEAFVREEEARLQALIQQEIEAQAKLGAERLLFRVVVTNIAADAGEEELWDIFNEFNIREITILPERHPIHRTRAAHVDFHRQKSAEHAAEVIDYIFGLKIHVCRAGDIGGESKL